MGGESFILRSKTRDRLLCHKNCTRNCLLTGLVHKYIFLVILYSTTNSKINYTKKVERNK